MGLFLCGSNKQLGNQNDWYRKCLPDGTSTEEIVHQSRTRIWGKQRKLTIITYELYGFKFRGAANSRQFLEKIKKIGIIDF